MSKRRNLRSCPALDKQITSRDCGEGRNSEYQCPRDCIHNPFHIDNYEQFQEIEERVDNAILDRAYADPFISDRIEKTIRESRGKDLEVTGILNALFFREVGEDGMTFGDRWEKAGLTGMKNDERVTLRCKMQTIGCLIEVQQVVDEVRLVCVNLLGDSKEPFTIFDRTFAARACRFQRFFTLAYPTPGYCRLIGGGVELKDFQTMGPREGFEAIVSHLGGELTEDWLTGNFVRVCQSISAVGRERHRLKLSKTDFNLVRVDYELGEFEDEFAKRLIQAGCIEDEVSFEDSGEGFDRALVWPDQESRDAAATSMGGTPYLGTVLLKPAGVRLVASRLDLIKAFRSRFEKVAGKKVRFVRELVENIAAQQSKEIEESDPSLVPPVLLENVGGTQVSSALVDLPDLEQNKSLTIKDYLETYYRKVLEEPVPQLDGLTPIEAAQDFVARPKLIEWAKGLVRSTDYQSLTTGQDIDVSWVLKELNLEEIDFPSPPKRLPIKSPYGDDFFDDFDSDDVEDLEDVIKYWEETVMSRIEEYDTAAMALDEMEASGFTLVDDFFELTGGLVDEKTYNTFIPMLIMVWAAIVPKGMKVSLTKEDCDRAIADALQDIQSISDNEVDGMASELPELCVEPELFIFLSLRFDETVKSLPRKERPNEDKIGGVMIALIAAINVSVDAVNRESPLF